MTGKNDTQISLPLIELFRSIDCRVSGKMQGVFVHSIAADSRKVVPGCLFVAVDGLTVDGHEFIDEAIRKGCVAVVVNKGYAATGQGHVPFIEVEDTGALLGVLAAKFYDNPARKMCIVGITGTNGKTTTTYLLENLIRRSGNIPGVIGTVNYRYGDKVVPAPHTTPGPVELQNLLWDMVAYGVTHVVMEVSSHALAQNRLQGLQFDIAVFTNLSRDHLDFHGDMENYFVSKKKLFTKLLKKDGYGIVCQSESPEDFAGEPDWGERLYRELTTPETANCKHLSEVRLVSCGINGKHVHAKAHHFGLDGIHAEIVTPAGECNVDSPLVGDFNLTNILGAMSVGICLGFDLELIRSAMTSVEQIPGRLEQIGSNTLVKVFVDYAHTPDALENVLETLRKLNPPRLVVVFGCGGDRDKGKRPLMGAIAARLSDVIIITSDNPRSEDPAQILAAIEQGVVARTLPKINVDEMMRTGKKGYDVIEDRAAAIAAAIGNARPGDVVLICGKGHEDYQITRQGKSFFDDRLEAGKNLDRLTACLEAAG